MTSASLREYTLKDLAQMAKKRGITGWHSMRKDDLIRALVRDAKASTKKNGNKALNGRASARSNGRRPVTHPTTPSSRKKTAGSKGATRKSTKARLTRSSRTIQKAQKRRDALKDLSGAPKRSIGQSAKPKKRPVFDGSKDCVVLMVRDSYWLHAHWELTSRSIQRAQAAMAESWHTAKPVLRVLEVSTNGTTSATEVHLKDIGIHGGVNDWYIDVADPPKGYRVEVGYLATNGRFHALARSNSVVTPRPGSCDALDDNWTDVAENCERIYALSGGYSPESASEELQAVLEERLRRPVGSPMVTRYGVGADPCMDDGKRFGFDLDAEMIIHGATKADAHVTIGGEPIKLRHDGTFAVRMSMPDRRQVLPVTSSSSDGMTQQTIVLAIERNTKVMEPFIQDSSQ